MLPRVLRQREGLARIVVIDECEHDVVSLQKKTTAQRPQGKIDEKLEQTISLTLKRIALKEKVCDFTVNKATSRLAIKPPHVLQ